MKKYICLSILVFFLFHSNTLSGNEQASLTPKSVTEPKEWTGVDRFGNIITKKHLKNILIAHKAFLLSSGQKGEMADFQGAYLQYAEFEGANLKSANLEGADLFFANLKNTDLKNANLNNATLFFAKLQWANLSGTTMSNANLSYADVESAYWELESNMLPNIIELSKAKNLSKLSYAESPHALIETRNAFKEAGLRRQERELTYAIYHKKIKEKSFSGGMLEWFTNYALFELTCKWGMKPFRPVLIMFLFVFIFPIFYFYILRKKNKKDGIWKVWSSDRARKDLGRDEPELLELGTRSSVLYGIYFSLLSTFKIGWRDFNIGRWISKIQPKEYCFKASGWARVVSGVQSLISVYLLALAILTYFGRPFD